MPTDWFHDLTGFTETSYADTQARLAVEGNTLRSTANGQSYQIGTLETPSLGQVDCLRDMGAAFGNHGNALWTMQNGYALCSESGLAAITHTLGAMANHERDALRDRLRVGLHWDVQVTGLARTDLRVSQAFCSALPVSYTRVPPARWQAFATLVLEGAYEATLWAAVLNAHREGSRVVFLTHLGGGAFGNDRAWIDAAMRRALHLVRNVDLEVRIVSYREPDASVLRLVAEFA